MITKFGDTSKWIRNLLENDAGLSVLDVEEFGYHTQGNLSNQRRARSLIIMQARKIEKLKLGIVTCRKGYYAVARKKDGDYAQSEVNKRTTFSLGTIQSVRRGAEVMYRQFPKLTSDMRIALLELINKAKDLEIVMLKEGKE
jgi:hypothetical protein